MGGNINRIANEMSAPIMDWVSKYYGIYGLLSLLAQALSVKLYEKLNAIDPSEYPVWESHAELFFCAILLRITFGVFLINTVLLGAFQIMLLGIRLWNRREKGNIQGDNDFA